MAADALRPQPGPQEAFLASPADIVIYGGAAFGGKTFALLLEACRHADNPQFGAVIFRRTTKQVRSEGGLWDTSEEIYPLLGAEPNLSGLSWRFPSGAKVTFAHLEHEKNKFDWQGSQVPMLAFDELTHFTAGQFWYLLSRNRSSSGVASYIRATTNPDPDSWVAELIDWWIGEDGYAIPERSGVIRWFVRYQNELIWADCREELIDKYPGLDPKSFTFIAASYGDNKIGLKNDPGYVANLDALQKVEREQLKYGNWKVRLTSGHVLDGKWIIQNFNPAADWDGPYYGVDWGVTDPTAAVRCWAHQDSLYVEHEVYGRGADDVAALLRMMPGLAEHAARADNAWPETIQSVRRAGFPRLTACEKWPGSVLDGVWWLRGRKQIVIHPRCTNAIREAGLWRWKTDAGDNVLNTLAPGDDHIWDAVRYAMQQLIRKRNSGAIENG